MAGPRPPPRIRAPTHKSDMRALEILETLPLAEWEHLIPEILTWFQDINWPVARPCRDLLVRYPEAVVEPVKHVFEVDDAAWQMWVWELIVMPLPLECRAKLKGTVMEWRTKPWYSETEDWWDDVDPVDGFLREIEEFEKAR